MDNILRMIGLCKKAGQLQIGEEPVAAAARARRAQLILLASDAADNTVRRARRLAENGGAPCLSAPCTKEQLGMALGRSSCAVTAVTDAGLAAAITRKLADIRPAAFGAVAGALEEKAQKVYARRREQAAHEKNVKRGKSRNPNGGESY